MPSFRKRRFRKKRRHAQPYRRMRRGSFRKRRGVFRTGPPQGGVNKVYGRFGYGHQTVTSPLPTTLFNKLSFVQQSAHTLVSELVLTELIPNDLFNVIGTQNAMFADRMITFYENWVVLGFSYSITFVNLETDTPFKCMVLPWFDDSDPTSDADNMQQQTGCRSKVVAPAGGSNSLMKFNGYVNINKLIGAKLVDEKAYWGVGSVGPGTANQIRFYLGTQNLNGLLVQDVLIDIKLTMYVKWFSLVNQPSVTLSRSIARLGNVMIPERTVTEKLKLRKKMIQHPAQPEVKEEEEDSLMGL